MEPEVLWYSMWESPPFLCSIPPYRRFPVQGALGRCTVTAWKSCLLHFNLACTIAFQHASPSRPLGAVVDGRACQFQDESKKDVEDKAEFGYRLRAIAGPEIDMPSRRYLIWHASITVFAHYRSFGKMPEVANKNSLGRALGVVYGLTHRPWASTPTEKLTSSSIMSSSVETPGAPSLFAFVSTGLPSAAAPWLSWWLSWCRRST